MTAKGGKWPSARLNFLDGGQWCAKTTRMAGAGCRVCRSVGIPLPKPHIERLRSPLRHVISGRLCCGIIGLGLLAEVDFPGEKWPQRVFWVSLLVNIGVLFSPLVDRPASRGELALFLLPDGFVVLIAMIAHNQALARSVRAQLIATVVVFTAACAALLALVILQSSAST